jgi:peroxiredoxin
MKNTILVLLIILFFNSAFTNLKAFKIIGTATGFADSTLLYLDDITDGSFKHIDSTVIINEKFTFKGTLKAVSVQTSIRTKDFENRCYLWLENAVVYFNGTKGKFNSVIIKGSTSQNEQYQLNALTNNTKDDKGVKIQFIKNNSNSIISAYVLSVYCAAWGRAKTIALFKPFSTAIKNTCYGKNIMEYLSLNKNIKIGDSYSDFTQKDIKGNDVKLSDFKGKIILLDFWGSWCAPCREANKEFVKIYTEYQSKGFEIFGVAAETEKDFWVEAIETDKLPWINVTDFKGDKNKAALIYGVSAYPTNYLIDSNGIIIAKDLTGDKLREKLAELLK